MGTFDGDLYRTLVDSWSTHKSGMSRHAHQHVEAKTVAASPKEGVWSRNFSCRSASCRIMAGRAEAVTWHDKVQGPPSTCDFEIVALEGLEP